MKLPALDDRFLERARRAGPPAVILDMDFQGLAIARALGRRGIPVIALDSHPGRWSLASRYCTHVPCPPFDDEPGSLRAMLAVAEAVGPGSVLFPLHDGYLGLVARHRTELDPWFRIPAPPADLLARIADKRGLAQLCLEAGVPVPRTHIPRDRAEIEVLSRSLDYPCLLKPASNRQWHDAGVPAARGRKVLLARSREELLGLYQALPENARALIVQEVIPGESSRLHYFVSYLDERSRPLGAFVGRKLRIVPTKFGAGTFVESVRAPEVVDLSVAFLRRLGYRGNVGVEWKLDPRDNQFKFIEMNARYGLWDGFAAHCGIDFAFLAWADLTGNPVPRADGYRVGQRWLNLSRDLGSATAAIRAGELTWGAWLASLPTARAHAVFARDDLAPFVRYYRSFLGQMGRQAARKLARRLPGLRARGPARSEPATTRRVTGG